MLRCLITLVSFAIVPGLILQAACFRTILPSTRGRRPRPSALKIGLFGTNMDSKQLRPATYEAGKDRLSLTAFRFHDPTGAFAAFQWQRPPTRGRP